MLRMRPVLLAVMSLLCAATSSLAQFQGGKLTARPDRGATPGSAYSVSDIDSVSLTGGGLSLSIPLASLPPIAGGKLGVTITASYNSKLWDVGRQEARVSGTIGRRLFVVDVPRLSKRGGWRIGGPGYEIERRDAHEDFDYDVPQQLDEALDGQDWDLVGGNRHWYRLYLITPDGAEHELVPTDPTVPIYSSAARTYLIGNFSDSPNGMPTYFSTVDGTYLNVLYNSEGSWTVTAPDGTQATLSAEGQRIKDTNGNSVLITGDPGGVANYKDEGTGREVKVEQDEDGDFRVSYQTVGGVWQHVDVNMGTTVVQGKFYRVNAWNAAGQTESGGQGVECVHDRILDTGVNGPNNPLRLSVIREIVFPATEPGGVPGRRFSFAYNSDTTESFTADYRETCGVVPTSLPTISSKGLGELSRVTTPTGAIIDYAYTLDSTHFFQLNLDAITQDMVASKKVTHDGGVIDTWTYDVSVLGGGGTVTNPDGTSATEAAFFGPPAYSYQSGSASGMGGKVFRSLTGNVLVERRWRANPGEFLRAAPSGAVALNPVVEAEYTSLIEGGVPVKMSAKKYRYDLNGNLTQTKEYDWFDLTPGAVQRDGAGVPMDVPGHATLLRQTDTAYYNDAPDSSSPNLYSRRATFGSTLVINAPRETTVGASVTRFSYDGQEFEQPPTKGNMTQVESWDDQGDAVAGNDRWVRTERSYDQYGNVETATDANDNVTTYTYDSDTHAQPTKIEVDPLNGTSVQTAHTTYDFWTGLVTSTTDANGQTTTLDYTNHLLQAPDPFGRPGTVTSPAVEVDGVSRRRSVSTTYEDSLRRVTVESDLRAEGDRLLKSRTTSDELGRTVLTEQSEDGVSYTISAQSVYEQGGRVTYTSNPRREGAEVATDGWTRVTRDALGRVWKVATFAGMDRPEFDDACNAATGCTGEVKTDYKAEFTTVSDQAGRARRSRVDGLGRLVRVDEPVGEPTAQDDKLGEENNPAQPTAYIYDALGNLTRVRQGGQIQFQNGQYQYVGGQERTFTYSTLSRLSSAENPESGKISYEHHPAGNLKQKTDARGATTTYTYDGLSRVTLRDYSDQTPDVSYTYEAAGVQNSVGRLTQVSSSVSIYRYTGYDALGRVTGSSQTTDGVTYTMPAYGYDLAGNLVSEQYPTGRVVKTEYDAAGRVAGVRNDATGHYYAGGAASDTANRIQYGAGGGVTKVRLGNGLWERTDYNSRHQPTQIQLGTVAEAASVLRLDYGYGAVVAGALDTARNNGNLHSQSITAPGHQLHQSYAYDELNRLKSAREVNETEPCPVNGLGTTDCWQQVYSYDRYGNRGFAVGTTSPALQVNEQTGQLMPDAGRNPIFDPSNNRIKVTEPGQGAYGYDEAGNLLCEPGRQCVQGQTGIVPYYAYDAENKLKSAAGGYENGGTTYSYDGDGRRVKKARYNGEVTVFVYDAAARVVAEYSNQVQHNGTRYLTQDHLGSTRVVTDAQGRAHTDPNTGAAGSRHDYFPFGEELLAGVGGRATTQGYGAADYVRRKFTGSELDDETGLNFMQARYFSSMQGRFIGVDPYNIILESQASAASNTEKGQAKLLSYLSLPQQWNRYSYVANNPLKYIDPTGENIELTGRSQADRDEAFERIKNIVGPEAAESLYVIKREGKYYVEICGNAAAFRGKGELAGYFSEMIASERTVEFQVATQASYRDEDGVVKVVLLSATGGGVTIPVGKSLSNNVQIFVHPDAGKIYTEMATKAAGGLFGTGFFGNAKSNNGKALGGPNETVDSHEFGHGYSQLIRGVNDARDGTMSLHFENIVRARLGLNRRKQE